MREGVLLSLLQKDLVANVIELLLTQLTTAPFSKDQERKDGKIVTCEVA
jgi:hypothetical protein